MMSESESDPALSDVKLPPGPILFFFKAIFLLMGDKWEPYIRYRLLQRVIINYWFKQS